MIPVMLLIAFTILLVVKRRRDQQRQRIIDENHNLYTLLSASCTSRVESSKVATIAETRSYDSDTKVVKDNVPASRNRQGNSPAVPQPNENS